MPQPNAARKGNYAKRRYTREQIDTGLLATYIHGGSAHLASEATGIPARTLRQWRQKNPDRYNELAEKHAPELEKAIVRGLEATVAQATTGTLEAIDKARQQLQAGEAKDPAAVARNLATVLGISTDKWMLIQGKPTHITEQRSAEDILRALRAKVPGLIVDSTAEDITPQLPA